MSYETYYEQLVLSEMRDLKKQGDKIRVSWNPGTPTNNQLSVLSARFNKPPRKIAEIAISALFKMTMENKL